MGRLLDGAQPILDIIERHDSAPSEHEPGNARQRRDNRAEELVAALGLARLFDQLHAVGHRDVDLGGIQPHAHVVGHLHQLLDLLLAGHEIGIGLSEELDLVGHLVEVFCRLLELAGHDLPPHPQDHRAFGRRPAPPGCNIHRQLRDDLGLEFLAPLFHPDKQAVSHVLELLDRRVVAAAGAPLGLEHDRLLDPR